VPSLEETSVPRADDWSQVALQTAARAGVDVRVVCSGREIRAVSELLAQVWGTSTVASPGPRNVLSAIADTGGYVAGAWVAGQLVGASFGVTYLDADGPALRSQVTGTLQPRCGIGEALKHHQRAWAHARGMRRITWTFDPLVRSNALFNLGRLGARIVRFAPDFYGSLDDGLNGSDETDRCVVSWEVDSSLRATGVCRAPDLVAAGYGVLVSEDGALHAEDLTELPGALVATPDDIVALRRRDPAAAALWRHSFRAAFSAALDVGLEADLVTMDGFYRFRVAP